MKKGRYYLYTGLNKKEYFSLPDGWDSIYFLEAEDEEKTSTKEMALEALKKPKGISSLRELISRAKNISIIVDDATRPTPTMEVLNVLLPELKSYGFSEKDISIVVALGTHEQMSRKSLETKLGNDVLSNYKVVQHNAWDKDLVPVKIPSKGKVVRINPFVANADLRIAISSVLPHPMAGYGGGPKIIMPGICDFEYIRDHHMENVKHPKSKAGIIYGNPFHEGCLEVAKAVGLHFSLNCVYNQKGEVIRIIAGDLEEAFKEAVELCFSKLAYKFEQKVDITISSTYPHTHGHQIFKGLHSPDMITEKEGAILLVAPIVSPIPDDFLNSINTVKEKSNHNPVEYVTDALSKGIPILPDKPMDFNMAMSTMFLRPKIKTILVSPNSSKQEANILGFEYASTIEEGLGLLKREFQKARVAIFPTGGLIVPVTEWS